MVNSRIQATVLTERIKERFNDQADKLGHLAAAGIEENDLKSLEMFVKAQMAPFQILDYVKRQTAHKSSWRSIPDWYVPSNYRNREGFVGFGPLLLDALEDIREAAADLEDNQQKISRAILPFLTAIHGYYVGYKLIK
jgi:hypothetical protein